MILARLAALVTLLGALGTAHAQFTSTSSQVPDPNEPGLTQATAIQPSYSFWYSSSSQAATLYHQFSSAKSDRWYGAQTAGSTVNFQIDVFNSSVLFVTAPVGFENLQLFANGQLVLGDFDGGQTYHFFGENVHTLSFKGSGPLSATNPSIIDSFAVRLGMTEPGSMMWQSLTTAVPEPDVYLMLAVGLGVLGVARRKAKKASPSTGV